MVKGKKEFMIGPCPKWGQGGYCNGEDIESTKCPLHQVLYGYLLSKGAYRELEIINNSCSVGGACPEYVRFVFPNNNYLELIGGGVLPGLKNGKGPCVFQVMKSNSKEILEDLDKSFENIKKGVYLQLFEIENKINRMNKKTETHDQLDRPELEIWVRE